MYIACTLVADIPLSKVERVMKTIRSARDRSHLMELGVSKELVDRFSGREANDLLRALLVIREVHLEEMSSGNLRIEIQQ